MLDHINVLPLIWASVEPGRFTMVSPWAEKGTLTSYIDVMHNRLTDVQVLTLVRIPFLTFLQRLNVLCLQIYDVAAGLHYCKPYHNALRAIWLNFFAATSALSDIIHGSLYGVCGRISVLLPISSNHVVSRRDRRRWDRPTFPLWPVDSSR